MVDGNGCWLLAAGDTVSSVSAAAAEPTLLDVGGWAATHELDHEGASALPPPPAPPSSLRTRTTFCMAVLPPDNASNNGTLGRGKREKKPVGLVDAYRGV